MARNGDSRWETGRSDAISKLVIKNNNKHGNRGYEVEIKYSLCFTIGAIASRPKTTEHI